MNLTKLKKLALSIIVGTTVLIHGSVYAESKADEGTITVTLLGTGSPVPSLERYGAATLVSAGGQMLLFDAGNGAQLRLLEAGVSSGAIDQVFLTHFHSDHLTDLADIYNAHWLSRHYQRIGDPRPFGISGPTGTKKLVDGILQTFSADRKIRIADEHLPELGSEIDVNEFSEEGVVYDVNGVTVIAFPVQHGDLIKPAFGYKISYAGHSVIISGDTRFEPKIAEMGKGVDLIVHEVVAASASLINAPFMQNVIAHHTTPEQAGEIFALAKPRMAVYTHFVLLNQPTEASPTAEEIIERTRATYQGPLVAGTDLMTIQIGNEIKVTKH